MKRPSSEQMKDVRKQLRTQPETSINNENSSEDDNTKKLSNVIAKKQAYYALLEDVEQLAENVEEGAAHALTRKTTTLASNESSSKKDNIEELSNIELEEGAYDVVEDVEQSAESVEEGAAHASMRKTTSLANNESSSEEQNVEKLSFIESEEEPYDTEEDLGLSSESEEEEAADLSTQRTESMSSRSMYGPNYFEWSVTPPTEKKQTEADEEWNHEPEVLSDAKDKDTPIEIWSLLFTDEMLSIIVKYTNGWFKASLSKKQKQKNYKRAPSYSSYSRYINLEELKALIGILYFKGLQKNSGNLTKLWESSPVFSSTMSKTRFEYLVALLQFDDKSTRQERRQSDRLAPIRDFQDLFISNCTKYYSPGKNVTIGEQLVHFRGKCPFLVKLGTSIDYIGLRIVMINDSDTYYMINAIPHLGKNDKRPQESTPSYYVRKLLEPIYHSHRNITCNKRFTSVPLVQSMKNEYSLRMVGTIRGKEKEIPLKMKKFTETNDSRFLYADNITLASYCTKQNKIVLVLSSLHKRGDAVVEKEQKIIKFYNSTKGGTDRFDQLCRKYSIVQRSERWVMKLFFAMLDQCLINSYILYNLNKKDDAKVSKSQFLKTLARQLYVPHIENRLSHGKGITVKLRKQMEGVVKGENSES